MAVIRAAEPLVNSLVNLAGLQGKEASKFAATGLEAINKNDAPGVFHWLSTIAEHKSNETSSYDKADFFTKAFGRLQEWGASFDADKPSSTNIADTLKMPAVKSYQKAYVEAANKALSDLKAIAALYTGTTTPTAQNLKSVLDKLEPKVRTEAMQNLLTEIAKPTADQNAGDITSWISQIKIDVDNPVNHIRTTFDQLANVATSPADANGVFANDDAKNFSLNTIEALQALASDATLMGAKPSKELVGLFQEFKLESYSSSTDSTEKPTHTADPTAVADALKSAAKTFSKKETELPALVDSSGNIDWKAVQEFKKTFAEHTPEGGTKITVEAQVAKLVEILKAHGAGLSDLTPEKLDEKITEMLKKPDGDGKGWGDTLWNIGKTVLTSGVVVALAIFFFVTGQQKKLQDLLNKKADQQEVVNLAQQIMATEQQDVASLRKEVRYAIVHMKDGSTKRVAIKPSIKRKTRLNASEEHDKTKTNHMNARTGKATTRLNAPEDESIDMPTSQVDDNASDLPPIENDLPPTDDGNMNPNDGENNQVDGNDQLAYENENPVEGNGNDRQVNDEDGRDADANSIIDGQPNSRSSMEGGNQIKPYSRKRSAQIPLGNEDDDVVRVKIGKTSLNINQADYNDEAPVKQVK